MLGSEFLLCSFCDCGLPWLSCDFGSLLHHSKDLNLPSIRLINTLNLTSSCLGICHSGKFNRDCIFGVFICVKSPSCSFWLLACSDFGSFFFISFFFFCPFLALFFDGLSSLVPSLFEPPFLTSYCETRLCLYD